MMIPDNEVNQIIGDEANALRCQNVTSKRGGQLWDARALVLALITCAKRSRECCQCASVANYQYHFPMEDAA